MLFSDDYRFIGHFGKSKIFEIAQDAIICFSYPHLDISIDYKTVLNRKYSNSICKLILKY